MHGRRLQVKVLNKVIDFAHLDTPHLKRAPGIRLSHVSWDKIPGKLVGMRHSLFAWYGYDKFLPVSGCRLL
jgi:hypothetical protein